MSYALVANTGVGNNGAGPTTTTGIDTTGATLLVVAVSTFTGVPNVTDSNGNIWLRVPSVVNSATIQMFYCANPTVGAAHTFTVATDFPGICVAAFSGTTTDAWPEGPTSTTGNTSLTLPTITPAQDDSIVVTMLGQGASAVTMSIDGGFTKTDEVGGTTAQKCALAYLIQTSAAAAAPTWTWAGGIATAVQMAVWHETSGGGSPVAYPFMG